MTPRLSALLALAVGLCLLPLRSLATSVVAPEFETLVNDADYVVRAVVKSVTSEWRENKGHKYIASKVELDVREVIKGTPPQPLVLEMVGGTVGEDTLTIEGAPKFLVGDEDVLFIEGNGKQAFPLVALMHGRYPIYRDSRSGQDYMVRSNGMPLYSEKDVSLPMTKLSMVKTQNSTAKPMSAADFTAKIRSVNPSAGRGAASSIR